MCDDSGEYQGSMATRYLKCHHCQEQWPVGVVFSASNADCCESPDIHVHSPDEEKTSETR